MVLLWIGIPMMFGVFCHPTSLGNTPRLWSLFSLRDVPGLPTGRKDSENFPCDLRALCSPGGGSHILWPVSPWRTLCYCYYVTVLASTQLAAQLTLGHPQHPQRCSTRGTCQFKVSGPGPTDFLDFLSESPLLQCSQGILPAIYRQEFFSLRQTPKTGTLYFATCILTTLYNFCHTVEIFGTKVTMNPFAIWPNPLCVVHFPLSLQISLQL